jgi:hypothetical protein
MVPLSFGCGSAVFAAIATLAPSRAAQCNRKPNAAARAGDKQRLSFEG